MFMTLLSVVVGVFGLTLDGGECWHPLMCNASRKLPYYLIEQNPRRYMAFPYRWKWDIFGVSRVFSCIRDECASGVGVFSVTRFVAIDRTESRA